MIISAIMNISKFRGPYVTFSYFISNSAQGIWLWVFYNIQFYKGHKVHDLMVLNVGCKFRVRDSIPNDCQRLRDFFWLTLL